MEKTGRELGRETSANEILNNLHKRYRPHRDKGNYNTRLRNMQKAFEEVMEVFDKKDLSLKENKEEFVKKCMSLTMECINHNSQGKTDGYVENISDYLPVPSLRYSVFHKNMQCFYLERKYVLLGYGFQSTQHLLKIPSEFPC